MRIVLGRGELQALPYMNSKILGAWFYKLSNWLLIFRALSWKS